MCPDVGRATPLSSPQSPHSGIEDPRELEVGVGFATSNISAQPVTARHSLCAMYLHPMGASATTACISHPRTASLTPATLHSFASQLRS